MADGMKVGLYLDNITLNRLDYLGKKYGLKNVRATNKTKSKYKKSTVIQMAVEKMYLEILEQEKQEQLRRDLEHIELVKRLKESNITHKVCRSCNKSKYLAEFRKDMKGKFGVRGTCRECELVKRNTKKKFK